MRLFFCFLFICITLSVHPQCYVSYSPKGFKDLPTIHVYVQYNKSDYYIGYTIGNRYDISPTVYNNHYEIYKASEYRFNGHQMIKTGNEILHNVESEFALMVKGRADHTGGVHGDEQYLTINFFIDGKLRVFTNEENLIPCKSFSYEQTSTLHESPIKEDGVLKANLLHPVEALHFKRTTFGASGYKTYNKVTWLKELDIDHWFFGICCVHKDTGLSFKLSGDNKEYTSIGNNEFIIKDIIGATTVYYKNEKTGLSTTVSSKLIRPKTQSDNILMMVWDREYDTKYYRGFYPKLSTCSGEIWEGEMRVKHFRE